MAVKIKSKDGHEAFVLEESVPAYEALGWKVLKNTDPVDPASVGEPQPIPNTVFTASDPQVVQPPTS